jgi:hypothetical protein
MKISWFITILILGVGAYFYQQGRETARTTGASLVAVQQAAKELGLDLAAATEGRVQVDPTAQQKAEADAILLSKQQHEAEVREFAKELIAFAVEMKQHEKSREARPPGLEKRMMTLMAKFVEMDEADMRILLSEVKITNSLDDKTRKEMVFFSCMMLSQTNPAASVKLMGEARDLMKGGDDGMRTHMLTSTLTNWAKSDPQAALAWADRPENADLVTADTKRGILLGIAQTDPQKALALALQQGGDGSTLNRLGQATAKESWKALLDAVPATDNEGNPSSEQRKHLLSGMVNKLKETGVEATAEWMRTANLNPQDRQHLMKSISTSMPGQKPAPWLEWMGREETDPAMLKTYTRNVIPDWTQKDFNGVGEWINQQPAGTLRESATQSFVETLAPHEPEAASVWALNLPASPDRTKLLQTIRDSWKNKDAPAADAFAAQHGLR